MLLRLNKYFINAIFLIVVSIFFFWNLHLNPSKLTSLYADTFGKILQILGIDQRWSMFAGSNNQRVYYYRLEYTLKDYSITYKQLRDAVAPLSRQVMNKFMKDMITTCTRQT